MKKNKYLIIGGVALLLLILFLASNKPSNTLAVGSCQAVGQSCGYQAGGLPLCCAGSDCQMFQCIATGSCTNGDEKCGSVAYPDTPGDVSYKCVDSTWHSQGRIDGKCGYVTCGVTGDSCSLGSGCCSPFYVCDSGSSKCKQGTVITCGNGVCDASETATTCPLDCSKEENNYLMYGLIALGLLVIGWSIYKK